MNKAELKKAIKAYMFLHLLLKEQLQICSVIAKQYDYTVQDESDMKVLSVSVESASSIYNYKVSDQSVIYFDEKENSKVYKLSSFIEVYDALRATLTDSKSYDDVDFSILIRFYQLVEFKNIDSFKLVLLGGDKIYNKKFTPIFDRYFLRSRNINKSVGLVYECGQELTGIKGLYADRLKIKQLKKSDITLNRDIWSLIGYCRIYHGVETMQDFYVKVCQINPLAISSERIKSYYKKEIERLILEKIELYQIPNVIMISGVERVQAFINCDKNLYTSLTDYHIEVSAIEAKGEILTMQLRVSFSKNNRQKKFVADCIETTKQLEILYAKVRSYTECTKAQIFLGESHNTKI